MTLKEQNESIFSPFKGKQMVIVKVIVLHLKVSLKFCIAHHFQRKGN
jgi:hypothetical protein